MPADVSSTTIRTIECVRQELKKWEWKFKAANGGRKPGRDDVKSDAIISAKYEEYDRLSGRVLKEGPVFKQPVDEREGHDGRVLKERSANTIAATPQKTLKHFMLPEKTSEQVQEPTPACVRFALGPTPQKDGAVLGLFDILSAGTPSKSGDAAIAATEALVGGTPSKSTSLPLLASALSTTPQSSAQRYYLEALGGTPLKRKRDDDIFTPSTGKRQYATPSFLRRCRTLPAIHENEQEGAGVGPPFKKRGLVRSLSAIIKGLKKQEDERMDDEWDVMNELEAEERGETVRPGVPKVLVEDSQGLEMPLGPDKGAESGEESDDDGGGVIDANGRPRKAWKKKGLKRQTRRVIMRPVLHKPKKADDDKNLDEDDGQADLVAETQLEEATNSSRMPRGPDEEYDSQDENGTDQDQNSKVKQKRPKPKKIAVHPQERTTSDETTAPKKGRKVNAAAHANFRKLKIKNKNSKANGRGNKFGRR